MTARPAIAPTALDHVALWVADRDAIAAADMHERLHRRLSPPSESSRTAPVPFLAKDPNDEARRGSPGA